MTIVTVFKAVCHPDNDGAREVSRSCLPLFAEKPALQSFLVDIDGTIVDIDGRNPMSRNPRAVCWDQPNRHVITVVNALRSSGFHPIFTSGRPECLREVTEELLYRECLHPAHAKDCSMQFFRLLMRPDDDFQPDEELKRGFLRWLRAGQINPMFAFDDRPKVVRMWLEEGLQVFQVGRSVGIGGDF